MNIEGLSLDSLKQFKNYMSFFEHAKFQKDKGLIKRNYRAPELGDHNSVRGKLTRLYCKALRSDEIFNEGGVSTQGYNEFTVKSVKRNTSRSSVDADYFMFMVNCGVKFPIGISRGPNGFRFKTVDRNNEVANEFRKRYIGKLVSPNLSMMHEEGAYDTPNLHNSIYNYILDNYELSVFEIPDSRVHQIFGRNVLPSLMAYMESTHFKDYVLSRHVDLFPRNRFWSISLTDNQSDLIFNSRQPYYFSNNYRDAPEHIFNDEYHNINHGRYHPTLLNDKPFDSMSVPEVFANVDNIHMPLHRNLRNESSNCFVLSKLKQDENGQNYIMPNILDDGFTARIKVSDKIIKNPELFFDFYHSVASIMRTIGLNFDPSGINDTVGVEDSVFGARSNASIRSELTPDLDKLSSIIDQIS